MAGEFLTVLQSTGIRYGNQVGFTLGVMLATCMDLLRSKSLRGEQDDVRFCLKVANKTAEVLVDRNEKVKGPIVQLDPESFDVLKRMTENRMKQADELKGRGPRRLKARR